MPRNPKYDILFEPVRIGPKTMRNRFYQTPHCSGLGNDYPGAQAHLRGMKAEGGWAMVNTEYCSIHPESDDRPWIPARLWNDQDVKNLSWMCERVHEHDSLAGVELHFGGAHHTGFETRLPARAVSQIPSETFWMRSPYEMDKTDIRELQGFYVAAAKRARAAGFDLILIYGAEASPITQQFLMPYFNKRTDEYGGSFENRARFYLEVLELVRDAVGDKCAVGARFTIDTMRDDDQGISVDDEGVAFVALADHLVDLWDIHVGGATVEEWADAAGPSSFRSENYYRPWVEKVRPHTTKPIVGVGRFTTPDAMVAAIHSGQLDIIGAARPSIADPFLPKKIEEGRLDEIRECIGCNICASLYNQGGQRIICTQNATLGEEYRRGWHPERFTRATNYDNDVLIVGGGPAGLEAAVVLGKRGMRRVHLVDDAVDVGGAMRWIPTLPGLGEWARVISYRTHQLGKLSNVEVMRKTRLETKDVLEYGAEIVVIATGATWRGDGMSPSTHTPIEGADASLDWMVTPDQFANGKPLPGERVVIIDGEGYFMAVALARKLLAEGRDVTFVTPFERVGPYTFFTGEGRFYRRLLHEQGAELVVSHRIERIEPGCVVGRSLLAPTATIGWETDAVLLVTQRMSNDTLWRALSANREIAAREGVTAFYRVGDCVAPRVVADAIFSAHRLAREIDSDDPSAPLPFIRESRLVGGTDADYANQLPPVVDSVRS